MIVSMAQKYIYMSLLAELSSLTVLLPFTKPQFHRWKKILEMFFNSTDINHEVKKKKKDSLVFGKKKQEKRLFFVGGYVFPDNL